jgi:hypothetical protein
VLLHSIATFWAKHTLVAFPARWNIVGSRGFTSQVLKSGLLTTLRLLFARIRVSECYRDITPGDHLQRGLLSRNRGPLRRSLVPNFDFRVPTAVRLLESGDVISHEVDGLSLSVDAIVLILT